VCNNEGTALGWANGWAFGPPIPQHIGVRAVEVHALDNAARRFSLKYAFVFLRDDQHHLFLPIQVIRQLRLPSL
jgi:hypothetical protein